MNLSTPIYLVKTRELQIYSWKKHNKSKISPFQLQISTMKRNKTEICAVVCMSAKNPVKMLKIVIITRYFMLWLKYKLWLVFKKISGDFHIIFPQPDMLIHIWEFILLYFPQML